MWPAILLGFEIGALLFIGVALAILLYLMLR
jgi:hypothetical protein